MSCSPRENYVGPCVHMFGDPILTIESVSSTENGAPISTINLFDIKIDNVSRNPLFLAQEMSENITVVDSVLNCTIPCGFGTEDGTYQFTVSAEGFSDSTFTILSEYNTFVGGCPSSSSDGTRMSFSLRVN
jgi:hypothetical protein